MRCAIEAGSDPTEHTLDRGLRPGGAERLSINAEKQWPIPNSWPYSHHRRRHSLGAALKTSVVAGGERRSNLATGRVDTAPEAAAILLCHAPDEPNASWMRAEDKLEPFGTSEIDVRSGDDQ
jgi:hypothetical protein